MTGKQSKLHDRCAATQHGFMGSWVHGGQLDGDHIVRCGVKGGLETCDVGVVVRTARNWSFFLMELMMWDTL